MQLETIRIVADWLADEANGVNALLAALPKDASDAAPQPVFIGDETRHAWATRKTAPRSTSKDGPALAVQLFEPMDAEPTDDVHAQPWQGAMVSVLIRYLTANPDSEVGTADGMYTMRAVRGSIGLLMQHANLAVRERNKVRIGGCQSIRVSPIYEEMSDVVCTAALVATFDVIDVLPSITP